MQSYFWYKLVYSFRNIKDIDMVNLLSVSDFRKYVPVNVIVDESIILAAINHAQGRLVPEITSREYYKTLLSHLKEGELTELEEEFLIVLGPALACYAGARLVTMAGNQIHPEKIVDAMTVGSKKQLIDYYYNQCSSYLQDVYDFCDENDIEYNRWKSLGFCSVVLGGYWS